jgi:hypothetical protein
MRFDDSGWPNPRGAIEVAVAAGALAPDWKPPSQFFTGPEPVRARLEL